MPDSKDVQIEERVSDKSEAEKAAVNIEASAGMADLNKSYLAAQEYQKRTDRPSTFVSRTFRSASAILSDLDAKQEISRQTKERKIDTPISRSFSESAQHLSDVGAFPSKDPAHEKGPNFDDYENPRPSQDTGAPRAGEERLPKPSPGAEKPGGGLDPTLADDRPAEIKEMERRFAEEIARTGRIPEELKRILENPHTSPKGLSVDSINRHLEKMNSSYRLQDQYKVPGTPISPEVGLVGPDGKRIDGVKAGDQPPKADASLEAKAQLSRNLAEQIAKTGEVPKELIDALTGKGSPDGVPIDVEEINKMLEASGSKVRLSIGKSKEGLSTVSSTENGELREKWVIVDAGEFGKIAHKVISNPRQESTQGQTDPGLGLKPRLEPSPDPSRDLPPEPGMQEPAWNQRPQLEPKPEPSSSKPNSDPWWRQINPEDPGWKQILDPMEPKPWNANEPSVSALWNSIKSCPDNQLKVMNLFHAADFPSHSASIRELAERLENEVLLHSIQKHHAESKKD